MPTEKLLCTGRAGTQTFYADIQHTHDRLGEEWVIVVTKEPGLTDGAPEYYAEFREMPNGREVRSDDLEAPEALRGLGITEAVFGLITRLSGRRVVSSSITNPLDGVIEHRGPHAEKMWQRFMHLGHATYDPEADRYTWVP